MSHSLLPLLTWLRKFQADRFRQVWPIDLDSDFNPIPVPYLLDRSDFDLELRYRPDRIAFQLTLTNDQRDHVAVMQSRWQWPASLDAWRFRRKIRELKKWPEEQIRQLISYHYKWDRVEFAHKEESSTG